MSKILEVQQGFIQKKVLFSFSADNWEMDEPDQESLLLYKSLRISKKVWKREKIWLMESFVWRLVGEFIKSGMCRSMNENKWYTEKKSFNIK